jgi:hypothetical protein
MIMVFSAINAPLIGYMLSHFSQTGEGYTVSEYQHAFSVMIFLTAGALILSLIVIKETFCKSMKENTILRPTKSGLALA